MDAKSPLKVPILSKTGSVYIKACPLSDFDFCHRSGVTTTWPLSSPEHLSGPNISPVLFTRNSSWSKEPAMLAYFIITFLMHKVGLDPIIKLGKWLARIHCICK